MPIYKVVRLPDGKKVALPPKASNRGGKVLYWGIENVNVKHESYQEAWNQLKAIQASKQRRAMMSRGKGWHGESRRHSIARRGY